jgi:hypothetical protein
MRCQLSLTKLFYLLCLLADSVGYHKEKGIKVREPTHNTDNIIHIYIYIYIYVYAIKLLSYAK